MTSFRINLPVVVMLLFVGQLFSLGSEHLGAFFTYLHWFLLFFLLLDGLHLLGSLLTLKYSQTFSTDHPQKHDVLYYHLYVTNQSRIPAACIRIDSVNATPADEAGGSSYHLFLKPGERWEITVPISCPYRGVYIVGLDRLVVSDLLGVFHVGLTVWKRTFYVYPRLIPLDHRYIPRTSRDEILSGEMSGNLEDTAYFSHLAEYRPGQSVRHTYWKRYSATGVVNVKQYDRTAQPGVELFLDRRGAVGSAGQGESVWGGASGMGESVWALAAGGSSGRGGASGWGGAKVVGSKDAGPVDKSSEGGGLVDARLRAEDITLELTLSLVQFFQSLGVPLTLHLSYKEVITVLPDDTNVIDRLMKRFLNLKFEEASSYFEQIQAMHLYSGGGALGIGPGSGARVCISHVPDFELLEAMGGGQMNRRCNVLYLNCTSFSFDETELFREYVFSDQSNRREVFLVEENDYL